MKILIACEFSGIVRDAFIARGHDAVSCDLLPTERPGPHIQGDVLEIFGQGWDMMIAFPPCTHLTCSGARWFKNKRKDGRQQQGVDFFMSMVDASIDRITVENPVGIMSTIYRPPDQIIQPYYFGDDVQKTTCLWLKNLPHLAHWDGDNLFFKNTHTEPGAVKVFESGKRMTEWYYKNWGDAKVLSETFRGIANAMAEQWG